MNLRKKKKATKRIEAKILKPKSDIVVVKPLPDSIRITIGKESKCVPYVDKISDLVSLETSELPIVHVHKRGKGVIILSNILRKTGVEPLVEIGDELIGKY